MDSIQRGDDFDYLKNVIENKMLYTHARINTIEKLGAFLAEYQGPSLEEAMTMNMSELAKRGLNLQAVPLTEDEHQKKQMDEAFELFTFYQNNQLGVVDAVISNTQVVLTENSTSNVTANAYSYIKYNI